MKLTLITPSQKPLAKEVEQVTIPGGAGSFAVLRDHADIVSTVVAGPLSYVSEGEEYTVETCGGTVRVADNEITVITPCLKG
ncbi:hypothetical protein FACS1894159_09490 [Bacteroidia bacterium]|nr:hypothetical protein FACS1894159_09490 [Bacteroidia bacterium]